MKVVKFSDPLYRAEITYLVGGTVNDMLKYLKKTHTSKNTKYYSWDEEFEWGEDATETDGYQFHTSSPLGKDEVFYVWVARASAYLLFHETFHLVGDIMNSRGITYVDESEESFAYLGGWIFAEFLNNWKGRFIRE